MVFDGITDSPMLTVDVLGISEELKDLLDDLDFEEVEPPLEEEIQTEDKKELGDR